MSLSADQVIADAAAANKTFSLQKISSNESTRIDTASTLANPRVMAIKHSVSGPKGVDQVDRHLVSFATTKTDGNGKQATVVTNITIALPRNGVVARADANDHIAFIRNWFNTTANVDALLLGQS